MKKHLLASSALASVMLVSGFASAEQSLSGWVYAQINSGDAYDAMDFNIGDAQLNWTAVKTTDSGLDATLAIEIDGGYLAAVGTNASAAAGDSDTGPRIDDAGISLSGDFGTVALGTFDHAANAFDTYAASVASGTGGTDAYTNVYGGAYLDPFGQADNNVSISYFSNDISGLSFGVSMLGKSSVVTDTAALGTSRSGTAFGGSYSAEFGEGSLQVRFGSTSIEDATYAARTSATSSGAVTFKTETDDTNIGVVGGFGAFSAVIATYTQAVKAPAVASTSTAAVDSESSWTEIGLGYDFGVGSVSYGSSTISDEKDSTVKDLSRTALSVTYNLGEGVALTFDNVANDITSSVSSTETILGINVAF